MKRTIHLLTLSLLLLVTPGLGAQETQQVKWLLPDLTAGPWLCAYYLIDSNEELSDLTTKEWAGVCADESDWVLGVGPFSNSPDQFRTTDWASTRQALLVRRHFTLAAAELEAVLQGTLQLWCSYDENPRIYLNGTLVWSATGWNDNDYARFTLSPRQKRLLREGDNVVAVSVMAGDGGGHIDLGLSSTTTAIDAITSPQAATLPTATAYDLSGRCLLQRPDKHRISIIQNGKKRINP